MAEFLITAKRHWSYKPTMTPTEQAEYDKQYQIGDIVQVFPDGKLSDYANAGGKFYVVRVSGLPYETALKYHNQWMENYTDAQGNPQQRMVKRRIYRVRAQDLPVSVRNRLASTYVYNTTWAVVRSYIRNQITNLDET